MSELQMTDIIGMATVVVAGGAAVIALVLGVSSHRATKRIQEKLFRYRELNEIVKWAIDIKKCETSVAFERLSAASERDLNIPTADAVHADSIEKAN